MSVMERRSKFIGHLLYPHEYDRKLVNCGSKVSHMGKANDSFDAKCIKDCVSQF